MADKSKIKWKGGRYGECPYVIIGNKKYYIADRSAGAGRWEYALKVITLGEGFDYVFRRKLSEYDCFELARAVKIFERWYRIKFNSKPIEVYDANSGTRRWERGHLVFWVDKPYGKPPRITCRSTGHLVDGFYDSMATCKHYANRILERELEKYELSLKTQLSIDFGGS